LPLFLVVAAKTGDSDFHLNALGRLIQQGQPRDAQGLRACVEALCNDNIAFMPDVPDNVRWQAPQDVVQALTARQMTRTVRDDWRVTSYSGLQQRGMALRRIYCRVWTLMPPGSEICWLSQC
jgi:exodeoxyribonuclease V beta subunit